VAGNLAISDVARLFGLRTSAIRYYERVGILPPPMRRNGQRRYDNSALFRLAVVQRARETGFTLEEIRELFFGFPSRTRPPKRWHQLSERKIAELREQMKRLKLMETLLGRVEDCQCNALDECGEKILREGRAKSPKTLTHSLVGRGRQSQWRYLLSKRESKRPADFVPEMRRRN
jgi:MerR family redox-sensitive transcriptional activator SoxR